MEEPEKLLMNLKFGSYTLLLIVLIIISILFDKIGE